MNNSQIKDNILISLVVIALFIISFTPFLELSSNNSRYSQQGEFNFEKLKTNANEIIIITPENQTYNEAIAGFYPATFGFENNILNSFPSGWIDNDLSTCETKVIGEVYGHNNVVQQYDNTGSAAAQMNKDIPSTPIITIEFWVRTDVLTILYFGVQDSSVTTNGWRLNDLPDFSADTWHHVRFVINTTSDKFDSYLDGVLKDNQANLPDNPMNAVDQIQFNTSPSQMNYNVWWDAIGGNWDPNYNIGDNLKEGLLLSFENYTNLEWKGYSLDGQVNKTILGNTTIPIPIDGVHNIQIFGNNTIGQSFQSGLRYFEVDLKPPEIGIIIPSQNNLFGSIAPDFSISITELNLNKLWYTLDNGLINTTFTGFSGTLNQTEWDKLSDGQVPIRFYANDIFGRENYTEITINKDSTNPQITINSPGTGDTFIELPPTYDITVIDDNLGSEWYTIDGGVTNFTISGLTGNINSTAWNNAPIGAVTIRFYSRDLAGNEVYQEVVVIKQSPSQPPSIVGYDMVILISVLSFFSVLIIKKISRK